jgi:hypothetical protein
MVLKRQTEAPSEGIAQVTSVLACPCENDSGVIFAPGVQCLPPAPFPSPPVAPKTSCWER